MIRSFVGVAVAVAMVGLLSSCSAAGSTSTSPTVPTPVIGGSASARHPDIPIPDGQVAVAPLTSAQGVALGNATIVKTGSQWILKLPPLDLGDPVSVLPTLADSPFSPKACGSDNVWEVAFVHQEGLPLILDVASFDGDPSFFTTLVLVRYGGATQPTPDAAGCIQPILATAPITWNVPDQRPWITTVIDEGTQPGARGSVEVLNGAPSVYVTAAEDNWVKIAARFGLSSSDLSWLNPNRLGGSAPDTAYAQQMLNLDPSGRGNSESRRPH